MNTNELKEFAGKTVTLRIGRRTYWGNLVESVDGGFSMKIGKLHLAIDPEKVVKIEEFNQEVKSSAWLDV